MAAGQLVPKTELFSRIRDIVASKDTGLITVLTDTKRSVLLRFSLGKLIHSNCRTKDVADAIQVLVECDQVKFAFIRSEIEDSAEIIAADTFLQLIDPGGDFVVSNTSVPSAAPAPVPVEKTAQPGSVNADNLSQALSAMTAEYIGPVADMVVEEALENTASTIEAIKQIATFIPNAKQAEDFQNKALARFATL